MTEGTQAITTIHLAWMAVLAVLAIVAIIVGMRLKRRRVEAQCEVEAHAEEAGVPIAPAEPVARTAAVPLTPTPLPPAPPPLADQPAPATPPVETAAAPDPLVDEPVAAAIAPDGTTATIAMDAAEAPEAPSPADGPLTDLKGLGPKVAQRLRELGIDRVGQLAALDDAQAAALDAELGPFSGRMARDRWIEQARLLAAGDREGFERVFGRL